MFANKGTGSLIIRLVLGIIFFVHGLQKFQGGIENTSGFFDSVGIPGFMAYVVAAIELVGGICLVLGLGTRIVSGAFFIIMLGAVATVKWSMGFVGGYELDLALMAMSLHLLVSGSSLLSLDRMMFGRAADQNNA
ncbi:MULTISPECIES: DoxX family protein [unclassified Paenibacillus]|uniref:DoxX family protein n=1 Tax=unclassified Paenibacillus TaxID=185978 RepID=UPI00031ED817|nr:MULTISPECIES: DoxX family protein [unclassified Paenibacillus]MCM3340795.1 DoxX family protein [Paenibacillus sp. MER TA 81-3]